MNAQPTEKEFLIGLALLQFNVQYSRRFIPSEFDIMSIPPNSYSDRGYEVISIRLDDQVRLRIYLTFDFDFFTAPYRVVNSGDEVAGTLTDEVYVTDIKIPRYYYDDGIYKFRNLTLDWYKLPVFLTEDGKPFLLEDGTLYHIPEQDPTYEST